MIICKKKYAYIQTREKESWDGVVVKIKTEGEREGGERRVCERECKRKANREGRDGKRK